MLIGRENYKIMDKGKEELSAYYMAAKGMADLLDGITKKDNKITPLIDKLGKDLGLEDYQKDIFKQQEQKLLDKFLKYDDLEYRDRKFIMPIEDIRNFLPLQNEINVFEISHLPKNIKFPIGHPVAGELYIGHPYRRELYIPYETHEEAFFVDKVHELCYLLQCLGATEITIESLNGRSVNELYNDSLSVSGGVGIKAFSGSSSYESNNSRYRGETSDTRRAMHLEFDPMHKPYVPKGLVWYPESTEWQSLVQNRIDGNMLKYVESISTKQTRIVSSAEQEKIKASARILWARANVAVEKNIKNNFKEFVDTEWKVSVIFRSKKEMDR